jgi:hypothetical protein
MTESPEVALRQPSLHVTRISCNRITHLSTGAVRFPNPNGIPPASPGLRPPALPWVMAANRYQPQRGCTRSGGERQPGHNPVGVEETANHLPRVGAGRQPWAGGHNPFGIGKPVAYAISRIRARWRDGRPTPGRVALKRCRAPIFSSRPPERDVWCFCGWFQFW